MKKILIALFLVLAFVSGAVAVAGAVNDNAQNDADATALIHTYFSQRNDFLCGNTDAISAANVPLNNDEAKHKTAMENAGVVRIGMQIVINELVIGDTFSLAYVTEIIHYTQNDIAGFTSVDHFLEFFTSGVGADGYYEEISGFKSGCYMEPPEPTQPSTGPEEPEPTVTEPSVSTEPSVTTAPTEMPTQNSVPTQPSTNPSQKDDDPTQKQDGGGSQLIWWIAVAFVSGVVGSLVTTFLGRKK